MSIVSTGMIGSLAGSSLPQSKGTDADRVQQDTANQAREVQHEQNAENAAGIGETEQHEQTSERDADGRRLWEKPSDQEGQNEDSVGNSAATEAPRSRDASGQRGNHLDLSG